jgi:hypothetical protein
MTRRRLWLITTLCCATLALPTVARLVTIVVPTAVWSAWTRVAAHGIGSQTAALIHALVSVTGRAVAVAGLDLRAMTRGLTSGALTQWRPTLPTVAVIGTVVLVSVGLAIFLIGRRHDRPRAAMPRRVRRLGRRGKTVSAIARQTGLAQDAVRQLLRPQPVPGQSAFADLLATSLDPTLVPTAGPRSNR